MKLPVGWSNTGNSGNKNWMLLKPIWMICNPEKNHAPFVRVGKKRKPLKQKDMLQEKESVDELSTRADRELTISRLLNAPIELVWEVFTEPEHIENWWGPNGFTNTIFQMEV